MTTTLVDARPFHPGMGKAVADRTILRPGEDWADVAERVSLGNSLLHPTGEQDRFDFRNHLRSATILMSGRHLQHGDADQPSRNLEVFSNCSTSAASFLLFYLLLNGSGVGRSYDDDMMLVNWDDCPTVRCVLDESHPDFDFSAHESLNDAKHKYGKGQNVVWFEVPDSREGWGMAIEKMETMAFQKAFRDHLLVLDFSKVRPKGASIAGMQNRPSSGPVPMMNALHKIATLKGAGLPKWLQAMYVDHYLAEPVLVGGARRAARMAVKIWTDKSVLDFIQVKRPLELEGLSLDEVVERKAQGGLPFPFLWSSNNSVGVTKDFWRRLALQPGDQGYNSELTRHAREVYRLVSECAYADGTGEPGLINLDELTQKDKGQQNLLDGSFVGSQRYVVADETRILLAAVAKKSSKKAHWTIVNPCVPGDTPILTDKGYVPIEETVGKATVIWNGKEWSEVVPFSTGVNPTVTVRFSDGTSLRCTPYHKFVIQEGYSNSGVTLRREAKDLLPGNKLAKFDMPTVEAGINYGTDNEAYSQGFYSGDGNRERNFSWVYEPKLCVSDRLVGNVGNSTSHGRAKWLHGPMKPKAWVPIDGSAAYCLQWLAGLFDADATVSRDRGDGTSIQLCSVDCDFLMDVRLMLTRLGVQAKLNRAQAAGLRMMPDGRGGSAAYDCKQSWRLLITPNDTAHLLNVGLDMSRLKAEAHTPQRDARRFVTVVEVVEDQPCETFCFTEPKNHTGTFNGIVTGQCGEIPLSLYGGYCVIADTVPFHADTLEEAIQAGELSARALIRVNLMDNLYGKETSRTNRIGVGQTGVHEFAWKFFRVGFRDLVNPDFAEFEKATCHFDPFDLPLQIVRHAAEHADPRVRAAAFWEFQGHYSRQTMRAAFAYADKLGVNRPHTVTTIKPAGTTSKLFGLSEGWHLPAMAHYLRWVQFRHDDPLVAQYEAKGYPVRNLKTYEGTTIVGFPTEPTIATLGMGDELVLAGEATPQQQYDWLQLGEFFWIEGGSVADYLAGNGPRPGEERHGGQISYTLKYKFEDTSYEQFSETLIRNQSRVRACSVMPETSASNSVYEYLPEEPVTKAEFEAIARQIVNDIDEDIGREHVDCSSGGCPIDFQSTT